MRFDFQSVLKGELLELRSLRAEEHANGNAKLLDDLTAHERAQVEFAQRELSGDGSRSLEPVLALLGA